MLIEKRETTDKTQKMVNKTQLRSGQLFIPPSLTYQITKNQTIVFFNRRLY